MRELDHYFSQYWESAGGFEGKAQKQPIAVPALVYFNGDAGGIVRIARLPLPRTAQAETPRTRSAFQPQMSRRFERVLALFAAIGFTAAIGLVAIGLDAPDARRRDLPADARDQGAPGAVPPADLQLMSREKTQSDRSVRQIDHGGD